MWSINRDITAQARTSGGASVVGEAENKQETEVVRTRAAAMQNRTDLSIPLRQYGVGLFIFYLPSWRRTSAGNGRRLRSNPYRGSGFRPPLKFPFPCPIMEQASQFNSRNNLPSSLLMVVFFIRSRDRFSQLIL